MTPSEKAVETRKRNKEMRKAQKEALKLLTERMIETCEKVLDDPEATSAERLEAVYLLNEIKKSR